MWEAWDQVQWWVVGVGLSLFALAFAFILIRNPRAKDSSEADGSDSVDVEAAAKVDEPAWAWSLMSIIPSVLTLVFLGAGVMIYGSGVIELITGEGKSTWLPPWLVLTLTSVFLVAYAFVFIGTVAGIIRRFRARGAGGPEQDPSTP